MISKEHYFDYAATSPVDEAIVSNALKISLEHWGNPSSIHEAGTDARKVFEEARARAANALDVKPDTIFFTSGGTESDHLDTNGTGKIDPKELKAAMQSLGFDSKNPTIFQLIADLDTPEAAKNGGIDFDNFVEAINNKLGDKETKEGIRRIFDLFIDDPNSDTITLNSLKKIARELGENMTAEELKDMLERASSNGTELTFDEFYEIMTKKSFP